MAAPMPKRRPDMPVYPGSDIVGDDLAFLQAIDAYKRNNQRPYPSDAEVLAVAKSIGFRKDGYVTTDVLE